MGLFYFVSVWIASASYSMWYIVGPQVFVESIIWLLKLLLNYDLVGNYLLYKTRYVCIASRIPKESKGLINQVELICKLSHNFFSLCLPSIFQATAVIQLLPLLHLPRKRWNRHS